MTAKSSEIPKSCISSTRSAVGITVPKITPLMIGTAMLNSAPSSISHSSADRSPRAPRNAIASSRPGVILPGGNGA